jgi:hypothetical protein
MDGSDDTGEVKCGNDPGDYLCSVLDFHSHIAPEVVSAFPSVT